VNLHVRLCYLKKSLDFSNLMVLSKHLLKVAILYGKPGGGQFLLSPRSYPPPSRSGLNLISPRVNKQASSPSPANKHQKLPAYLSALLSITNNHPHNHRKHNNVLPPLNILPAILPLRLPQAQNLDNRLLLATARREKAQDSSAPQALHLRAALVAPTPPDLLPTRPTAARREGGRGGRRCAGG